MILCIGMGRISLWNADRTQISQCVENFYAILTGILILVLQFGLIEHRKISHDIDAMRQLLHEQYVQYENSKTNMQLVNEKNWKSSWMDTKPSQIPGMRFWMCCFPTNGRSASSAVSS